MTTQTDLGHGRGWASPTAAASIRRIDAQLGRLADINEAGRSPEKANENRRKWLAYERYLNGGPWAPKAPFALGADESVHCWGDAADSDDWYDPRAAAVWRDNGWRQTARYPGNPAKDEIWHGEHFVHLDNHRYDPTPTPTAAPQEDAEMNLITWNGRVWLISDEKCAYVRNDQASLQMAKLLAKQALPAPISNDQLTELLFLAAIPWAALDATFRSQAFDNMSRWGAGTVWSRQIAEGHEDKLRDDALAQTLDELLASTKA